VLTAESTRFDVEFHFLQEVGRLSGGVLFATDLFEPQAIRGMVAIFQDILRHGLEQPRTLIATLPLTEHGTTSARISELRTYHDGRSRLSWASSNSAWKRATEGPNRMRWC